jgi:pyruvate kinase
MKSTTQIIATIGPASKEKGTITDMIKAGMDIARLNFSWGTHEEHAAFVERIRRAAGELDRSVAIIQDLSGPRIQEGESHGFDDSAASVITAKDRADLAFTKEHEPEYVAQSFVGSAADVIELKGLLQEIGSSAKVIAKIERQKAVDNIDEILDAADAIMVARGDLGNEVPLEKIPFVQIELIQKARAAGKLVAVATEMMSSMVENEVPARSDVTDVAYAVVHKADAIMLSNETAVGKHPVAVVEMMERIALEAEKYHGTTT